MKSKIRVNRNCPKWHKHLYPLVWCAQHRFESARWSLRVHPFHSWGSGQWAGHSFPYFLNLKLPLKGIRSTPPVYFTSVSILAKARTCDTNEVEASANAFFLQTIKIIALNKPSKEVLHSWLFRNSRERECGKEIGFLTLSSTARVCKNKGEAQEYLLLFISRRSLPTVLVCSSCCQDDLFVSSPLPLRIICPLLTRRWVGGKKETKISDMYLLRPIVATKKT